jgi:hypothetical protein
MARRTGAVVELIRNDAYGQVSVEALRAQQLNVSVSSLTSTRLDMAARAEHGGARLGTLLQHR